MKKYLGDPMSVHGNAVKITSRDGTYEIICDFWDNYVKNSEEIYSKKRCNETEFHQLMEKFLPSDYSDSD